MLSIYMVIPIEMTNLEFAIAERRSNCISYQESLEGEGERRGGNGRGEEEEEGEEERR